MPNSAIHKHIDPTALSDTIMTLARERGSEKTICPSEAARKLVGSDPDLWGAIMPHIRKAAVSLAREGRVVIYRKGKAVTPDDLKGVYRIGLPRAD